MIHLALTDLYQRIDADVASRNPVCELSGRCCNFDVYGHRLYVTGLEIAWFLHHAPPPPARPRADHPTATANSPQPPPEGCPYQCGKICSVHTLRPLGCRLFFCDPAAEAWLNDVHEHYLAELRRLHDTHHIPYAYMEWRAGLAAASTRITPATESTP